MRSRPHRNFKDPLVRTQFKRLYVKPALHYKHRAWEVDQDYIDKLEAMERSGNAEATEALDYLNKFLGEYYHNTGIPAKPNPEKPALHNTDTLRKDCYNRTNRAARDLYSVKAATGWLESEGQQEVGVLEEEDLYIRAVDAYAAYVQGQITEDEFDQLCNMLAEDRSASKTVIRRIPKVVE